MSAENGNGAIVVGDAEEIGTDLEVRGTPQAIFRTEDPMEIMRKTTEVATALKQFVSDQGLVKRIGDRDYIVVEGWQMLGMMLGVTPAKVQTHQVENGWEAIVELHDRNGRIIGSGEAECLKDESTWKGRADYARRSMAQTRAVGKAYRNTFGFIAKAAGYEALSAEEAPEPERRPATTPEPSPQLSDSGVARVIKGIEDAGYDNDGLMMLLTAAGVESREAMTLAQANEIKRLIDESKAPAK